MADISLTQDGLDDSDEGVYEQGDGFSGRVDDALLTPLMRIQKYAQSNDKRDRSMVWRILADLFKSGPPEAMTASLPDIMNVVSKSADNGDKLMLNDLIDHIPNLAALARKCSSRIPALKTVVSDYFLPIVDRNLYANETYIRAAAETSMLSLMELGLITKVEAEIKVCPTLLALSHDEYATESQVGAVTLMSKMTTLLGRDGTERVFLDHFSQLCKNKAFYVRKACASYFGEFCSVVGKEACEKTLLPCYIGLCSDEIWGVRKACAEVAMSVSCACAPATRRRLLAPAFIKLLQDNSRWVRMSAFQTLGPFISTFADPAVSSFFYNNVGELMSVNMDGREFRAINSTSTLNRLNSLTEDFIYGEGRYNESECDEMMMLEALMQEDGTEEEEEEERSGATPAVAGNVTINIPAIAEEEDVPEQPKLEDVTLQKNVDVVFREEEVANKIRAALEESEEQGEVSEKTDDPENFKEIVETVKNALLSFRVLPGEEEEGEEKKFDSGVGDSPGVSNAASDLCDIDLSSSSCADVSSPLGNISSLKSNSDTAIVSGGSCGGEANRRTECDEKGGDFPEGGENRCGEDDDSLLEYNSYNYWYIRPEMPVDLSIVSVGCSSTESNQNFPTKIESPTMSENTKQPNDNQQKTKEAPTLVLNVATDKSQEKESSVPNKNSEEKPAQEPAAEEEEDELEWQGVPKLLIAHFVSMTSPSLALEMDNEMAFHCAHSLPAVALTLGSKNWHLLKDTVETLASNMHYKVRRTVASSLHELAVILGPELATDNLTPIFDGFIKDLDEVRIGVLKHLAHFLRLISPAKRSMYLPRFADFLQADNELNWRYRQELAEQLRLVVPLYRPADAAKYMTTIAQVLLSDKVDAVRQAALALITDLLKHISTERDLTPRLLIILAERFAHAKRWKLRQTFVLLCAKVLAADAIPMDLFASDVMPHLLDLSWDPVANVRLAVARTLSRQIIMHPYFSDPNNQYFDNLQTVLRRLQADKDQDVRHLALIENYSNFPSSLH